MSSTRAPPAGPCAARATATVPASISGPQVGLAVLVERRRARRSRSRPPRPARRSWWSPSAARRTRPRRGPPAARPRRSSRRRSDRLDPARVRIEAHHAAAGLRECKRQGQAHVAKPHHPDAVGFRCAFHSAKSRSLGAWRGSPSVRRSPRATTASPACPPPYSSGCAAGGSRSSSAASTRSRSRPDQPVPAELHGLGPLGRLTQGHARDPSR